MSSRSEPAIRRAVPADADALVDIFARSIRELAPPFYTRDQVEAWASSLTVERAQTLIVDHVTYVAEIDTAGLDAAVLRGVAPGARVIGFATFAEPDQFEMLYVDPERTMQGVGAALAAVVEQHARALGVRRLGATASDCARLAFESFGFRHEQPHTRTLDGHEFSVTLMTMALH